MQRSSQYISAEQGVACPLGGKIRFLVFLKVNEGIPGFSCFISETLPRKKSDIQALKHIKFYLFVAFGVSNVECPDWL